MLSPCVYYDLYVSQCSSSILTFFFSLCMFFGQIQILIQFPFLSLTPSNARLGTILRIYDC